MIDDDAGHTLAAASDLEADVRGSKNGKTKTDVAKLVGELVGQRAKEQGITQVVFDRGGYRYHGRVKALADAAREAGLRVLRSTDGYRHARLRRSKNASLSSPRRSSTSTASPRW